jgi:hypothetical protein
VECSQLTSGIGGPIDSDKLLEEGKKVTEKTYHNVNNSEVRDLLSIGFAEMSMNSNSPLLSCLIRAYT